MLNSVDKSSAMRKIYNDAYMDMPETILEKLYALKDEYLKRHDASGDRIEFGIVMGIARAIDIVKGKRV